MVVGNTVGHIGKAGKQEGMEEEFLAVVIWKGLLFGAERRFVLYGGHIFQTRNQDLQFDNNRTMETYIALENLVQCNIEQWW